MTRTSPRYKMMVPPTASIYRTKPAEDRGFPKKKVPAELTMESRNVSRAISRIGYVKAHPLPDRPPCSARMVSCFLTQDGSF